MVIHLFSFELLKCILGCSWPADPISAGSSWAPSDRLGHINRRAFLPKSSPLLWDSLSKIILKTIFKKFSKTSCVNFVPHLKYSFLLFENNSTDFPSNVSYFLIVDKGKLLLGFLPQEKNHVKEDFYCHENEIDTRSTDYYCLFQNQEFLASIVILRSPLVETKASMASRGYKFPSVSYTFAMISILFCKFLIFYD